jgi:hypothetical protein
LREQKIPHLDEIADDHSPKENPSEGKRNCQGNQRVVSIAAYAHRGVGAPRRETSHLSPPDEGAAGAIRAAGPMREKVYAYIKAKKKAAR